MLESIYTITLKSLPYIIDLASSIVLKLRHPKSLMARDRQRFLTIPDTFKSSKTVRKISQDDEQKQSCNE